jgi:trigger factor
VKSAVENLSPTRVKLTVEVPFEEFKPELDAAYKTVGAQVQIPGFRKGKVPARIIDQRVGRPAVVQEAINEAMPRFFSEAMEQEKVRAIGQPEVDFTKVPLEDGDAFEFTVETDVRPELELPDLEGIAVEVDPAVSTDEDVDNHLEELRVRFGTVTEVDRSAAEGDLVTFDLSASVDGELIDTAEDISSYQVGSKAMLEGMDDALVGMSAGESKDFSAPLLGGEYEGRDADCTITLKAVKQRELPELDDDFAQLASQFDTLAELREDATTQVLQRKRFEQGVQARDKVLEHLLSTVEVPVPEGVVAAEVERHFEEQHGGDPNAHGPEDEHRAEVESNTRESLKTQFLLDALAEKLDVNVEQPELVEYIVMSAQQYGMDPNTFAQAIDQQGQVPAMVQEVARRKALAAVLEQAKVTDSEGTEIDLNALVPGAEEADAIEAAMREAKAGEAGDQPGAESEDLDDVPARAVEADAAGDEAAAEADDAKA